MKIQMVGKDMRPPNEFLQDALPVGWEATTKRMCDGARIYLLRHPVYKLFSGVLVCGSFSITESVRTAETDGWNVRINPRMVLEARKAGTGYLAAILLHEALHKVLAHCTESQLMLLSRAAADRIAGSREKGADLFAWAVDKVVNTFIHQLDEETASIPKIGEHINLMLPDWAVTPDPTMYGWSTKQVIDWAGNQSRSGGQGGPGGICFDVHTVGSKKVPEQAQAVIQKEVQMAATASALSGEGRGRGRGKGRGGLDTLLGALFAPRISYLQHLRAFLRGTKVAGRDFSTWSRVDRRHIASGLLMPGMAQMSSGSLVLVFDSSGSTQSEWTRYASEMQGLINELKPSEVHVLMTGTRVERHDVLRGRKLSDIQSMTVRYGGGTALESAFEYMIENRIKCEAVVVFTDGETSWPTPEQVKAPLLWVITSTSIQAPVGITINLNPYL